MRQFVLGLLVGLLLGVAVAAHAYKIVDDGGNYLWGWSVYVNYEFACYEPEVSFRSQKLYCTR